MDIHLLPIFGPAPQVFFYLLILDKKGRIIYAKSFPTSMNGGFLDFKPQPNNKYSFYDSRQGRYYIMDRFFNIIDTVVAKNGYSTNDHELFISRDNHYFIIADEIRTVNMSLLVSGGNTNAQITGNIIQEIDSNNNLMFQWKALDHIPITDYPGNLTAPSFELTHTNALFLDSDTSIMMSNPSLNEITKISLNSGNIIWRLGLNAKGNQFTFIGDTLGFIFQHYATRLSNGNLTLFDNGLGRYARALEYEIDEVNKTARLVFQFRQTPDVTGPSMGSVNRLPNGNTFIGWGSACKMTEVDTSGNKVFEASFPSCTYRALKYDIPSPILQLISGPSEICKGQAANYTATPCSGCTYSWSVTNGTIISGQGTNILTIRWPIDGSGNVKLTKTNSLNYKDYFLIYVTVTQGPKANIGVVKICKGARYIDSTTNSVSRFWDFGDGHTSTLANINHIYSLPGKYQVKLKVMNSFGCTDSIIEAVTILDLLKADFSIDTMICRSETTTLKNNSTNADAYSWYLHDSLISVVKNPAAFSFPVVGSCNIKLIATGSGCIDSLVKTVHVNPNPIARFGYSEICHGSRFKDSSVNLVSRLWDFGDGDTAALSDINHTYSLAGTYQVKLKVMNSYGCTDSVKQTIIVHNTPKAEFSMDTMLCRSETTAIINNSTDADAYYWYLRDSLISALKNPLAFSFPAAGSFPVKLLVTGSGCRDSLTKTVVVNPNPKACFGFGKICLGASFADSSINTVSRIWDFGDGTSSILTDVDHIFSSSGTYQVKLKVFNDQGCADSSIQTVIINDAVHADFSIDSVICVNEKITIINNSTNADSYFWNLGDSHTSNLMVPAAFSYTTAGSYQVKLLAFNSICTDSVIQTVFVMPIPAVKFSSTNLTDFTIQFNDSSAISAGSIVAWDWNFGDGKTSTIQHPVHTYSSSNTYTIKLCATSNEGCEDCDIKSILVKTTGIGMLVFDHLISIFPNPNSGIFTLKTSKKPDLILISNALGQEILVIRPKTDTELIDLTKKPDGVYIVKIRLENHDEMIRIIKN